MTETTTNTQAQPDNLRLCLKPSARPQWPERIIVEPARIMMGVFGYTQGDISAAYCADTLPKARAFTHEGRLFASMGGGDREMQCHPLLSPEEYIDRGKQPYSYEGRPVTYQRRNYILGPKIIFAARPLTLDEGITLLRRMYAHGGYFVSGKTYLELLREFQQDDRTRPDELPAIERELTRKHFPQTQAEMRAELNQPPGRADEPKPDIFQLELPGM